MGEDHRWIPLPTRRGRLVTASIMVVLFVAAGGFAVWGRIRLDTWGEVFEPVKAGPSVSPATLQAALAINVVFLITTALFVACGSILAASLVRHRAARAYAEFGLLAAGTIIVAGIAADTLRLTLPASGIPPVWYGTPKDWEIALMVIVVSAEVIGWPIAVVGFGVALSRRRPMPKASADGGTVAPLEPGEMRAPVPLTKHDAKLFSPAGGAQTSGGSWARGYNVPESQHVQRRRLEGKPIVGICLSGGGVRAGSLALGVLQSTEMRKKLTQADYLVSVSGGGYIAGAFQQALTDAGPDRADGWTQVREPASTLMSGTAEEDHVRRRASYLANTPGQLAIALGRIAAHLVITLGLLFAPAVAVGIILGVIYANQLPLVTTHDVWEDVAKALPPNITWVCVAVLIPLVAAGLSLLLAWWGVFPRHFRRATKCFTLFAAATAVIAIGIPVLIGLAKGIIDGPKTTGQVVTTSVVGTLAAYVISLISIGRQTTENLSKHPTWFNKVMKAPGAVINMILVVLIVVVIAAAWLLLLGGAAAATISSLHAGHTTLPTGPLVAAGIILVIALLIGVWVDETRLSLHPFYRARLAWAFAVRRIERDGVVTAEEYDPTTETTLSTYGRRPGTPDADPTFPEVIFAASATIGGGRTPAGTNRVSYTFSGDWVGGPEVGYIATSALERFCPPAIARDLTVQSAVAISGAAISASGGGQGSPWYGTLFALSGVRLGSWLPNPAFVMERYRAGLDPEEAARLPRIPRIRRIDYLVKELMGPHTYSSPMLQVTDGGFYDNLGLLELLRRRCTEIYAIDASGEVNSAPSTLARAISLAEQELGVQIDFSGSEIWNATAGSGNAENLPEALTDFKGRLGSSPILVGQITYPEEAGLPVRTGTIRVARASLWPDLPPDVIAYAFGHNAFPNDSTADQWFFDDDYRAYTSLGNKMGDRLATAGAAGAGAGAVTKPS